MSERAEWRRRCVAAEAALARLQQERDAALAERDALVDIEAKSAGHHLQRIAALTAALTEARRVLRDVVVWVDKGCPDGCPVCPGQDVHAPDCARQAALGRGEEE